MILYHRGSHHHHHHRRGRTPDAAVPLSCLLILSPKLLQALPSEGLRHLRVSKSAIGVVFGVVFLCVSFSLGPLSLCLHRRRVVVISQLFWAYRPDGTHALSLFPLQLFRRVAAALPGMDTTQDKSREDSILRVRVCVCVWWDTGVFSCRA